ncbi:Uncharacterized protein HZ326_30777 [Fusarium oxysporum f. sp. albedinis]|nr:Uncharacterized protein HZ326_30777 [Fusarium oxysporum f. sp. albedinis]
MKKLILCSEHGSPASQPTNHSKARCHEPIAGRSETESRYLLLVSYCPVIDTMLRMVIVDDGIVAGKATGRSTHLLSTMQLMRFVAKCQDACARMGTIQFNQRNASVALS